MRKTTLLSVLLSLFISNGLNAQKDFLPGTLTLAGGDTLSGYINYQNWTRTPAQIEFRKVPGGSSEHYGLHHLEGFEIRRADRYTKDVIWKDTENPDFTRERYEAPPRARDTVFLRSVVETAKFSLYEYRDDKIHFYLRPQGDTLQELLNPSVYNAVTGHYDTRPVYRDQLKKWALGHSRQERLIRIINALPYREAHLRDLVRELAGEEKTVYVNPEEGVKSRQAFVAGGVIFSITFPDAGDRGLVPSYKKTSAQVSGGVDFFSLRSSHHLFLRTELRLGNSSFETQKQTTDFRGWTQTHQYTADYLYFNPAVHVLFPFMRTENARLYGGGGISYTFIGSLNYKHTVNDHLAGTTAEGPKDQYASGRGWGGPQLTLGWMYQKKFEVRLFRNLGGMLVPESNTKYNGLLVGYRF